MSYPFLGEFTVAGQVYTVTEDCYDEPVLRELRDEADIVNAVKEIAIQRAGYSSGRPADLNRHDLGVDPIDRFLGDIVIFDANNLAHRVRHSYSLSNNGLDVSVTYGFLNVLAATVRKYNAKSILVLWDDRVPEYRRELMPEYKANRSHDDDESYDDFLRQVHELEQILPLLGVFSARLTGCEADDAIYHATRILSSDYRKIVVSSDMDLAQCVCYHTQVYNPHKDELISRDNFQQVVGVQPYEYLTYKCLIGDSSDNLPGCPGIGPVKAQKLIGDYGHHPNQLLNAASSGQMSDSLATKLKEFGPEGFDRMMGVVRLDLDLCGARLKLFRAIRDWQPFQLDEVKRWLMSRSFISLAEPDFYNLFKPLEPPRRLVEPEIGYKLHMPAVIHRRTPLRIRGAKYGQS